MDLGNIIRYTVMVFTLLGVCRSYGVEEGRWVTVQKAIDGDTLRLADGSSVRLIGIDAPEIDHENHANEYMSLESRRLLNALTEGKSVRLVCDQTPKDHYGRILAYVYDSKGRMLNLQVIESGLAHVLYLYPDVKAFEMLLSAQRQAMIRNLGKWRNLNQVNGPLVGNSNTRRFHKANCPSTIKIASKNTIPFENDRQAFWEGYAPCRRCFSLIKKKS